MGETSPGPLTIVFTDIEGSTSLWDHDEETMRVAHTQHNRILSDVFTRHRGVIVKDKGDGFIVTFSNPVDAVEACAIGQRQLDDATWPGPIGTVRVRMAVNTGVVEARDGDYYGPVVNLTARIESLAHGGQILVSETTKTLVSEHVHAGLGFKDLGQQRLRGVGRLQRIYQVLGDGIPDVFPPLLTGASRGIAVPAFHTRFMGRESERNDVAQFLRDGNRLVTLLGPGGIGKTRLACETASLLADELVGGVHFADLAPLSTPEQVGFAIAESVGVHVEGTADILELVGESVTAPTLVVLDNYEHVVAAATDVSRLLATAAPLSFIATSRQPLGISGEHIYRLSPLDVSANGAGSPAVELFYDRAAAQGTQLTEDDRSVVESICRRLDGLPLAIELVAPRTRLLSLQELETVLKDSLDTIGSGGTDLPERHRTIRAAIDWSVEQLTDSQRMLFARLATLPAGATLEMVERVCAPELTGSTLDNIATLVDNSLVTSVPGLAGGTRFRQLALLREYGLELLKTTGDYERTMGMLVDHYIETAQRLGPALQTDNATDAAMAIDHANLLVALDWSLQAGRAQEMAEAMLVTWIYWFKGDRIGAAVDWTAEALKTSDTPELRWLAGFFAFQTGDFESLAINMALARQGFEESGNQIGLALSLMFASVATEDPEEAYSMLDTAHSVFDTPGTRIGRFMTYLFLSIVDFQTGDLESSLRRRQEGLAEAVELGSEELTAWMHWNLSLSYYASGRYREAAESLAESFEYMVGDAYQEGVASSAEAIALLDIKAGNPNRGVTLLGAAKATFERIGTVSWFEAGFHLNETTSQLKETVGEAEYKRLFAAGMELSFTETIDLTYQALDTLLATHVQ